MIKGSFFGLLVVAAFAVSSCVEPYQPEITYTDAVKFVITGQVNKGDEVQNINITTTSPVSKPLYLPVSGCRVKIIDSENNTYEATDMNDGNYQAIIPENRLVPGSSFKVDIVVPDGTHIVSDYDSLSDCPEVDSVYYVPGSLPSDNTSINIKGIRFYVDLDAVNYSTHFFRWEAVETWEFRAVYPIEWIYDGKVHHIIPPDYSRKVCWNTTTVKNIFTLSTQNLANNKYSFYPLHFVDNKSSPRLVYGISLLLKQYSLSEAAYQYWEKLRVNSLEQGGLYEKQPMAIIGNLHNVTNPEKQVLGFFGASTVKSKRIFVKNVENLPIEYDPGCGIQYEKPLLTFKGVNPPYPVYLFATEYGFLIIILPAYCYDCRSNNGDTLKPDFWPY